jgi:hypothetical protein
MRRPAGVVIAGVLLLLLALFGLLMIALQVLGLTLARAPQTVLFPHGEQLFFAVDAVFAAVFLLCGWVAVDLFRMRAWARYAAILLGALIAAFGGMTAVVVLLLRSFVPLPVTRISPESIRLVLVGVGLFYFAVGLLALGWVIYFNFASVRAAFAQAAALRRGGESSAEALPILGPAQMVVWITAVCFILGSASLVVLAWLGLPMFLLGWVARGPAALLLQLLLACLLLYSGIGLFRRWHGGWLLAVGLQLYSLLAVLLLLVPSYAARLFAMSAEMQRRLAVSGHTTAPGASFLMASAALNGFLSLAIVVALVRRRHFYID